MECKYMHMHNMDSLVLVKDGQSPDQTNGTCPHIFIVVSESV